MALVFDASALIAFLRNEAGADQVRLLLDSQNSRYIHAINMAEVFYDASRQSDVLIARANLKKFTDVGLLERTDLDVAFREDVAQIKADWRRISLADCCGLALARRLGAEFVTSDHHELDALDSAHVARFQFFR